MRLFLSALAAAIFLASVSVNAQQSAAYGVDSDVDSLYTIDVDSGASTFIGPLGSDSDHYTTPISLAIRQSDGAIFVANNSPDADRGISRLDPKTGRAILVVPSESPFYGITFNASDQLVVQLQLSDGRLTIVDLNTGQLQPLGGSDVPILYSLATNPIDGAIYGLSATSTMLKLLRFDDFGNVSSTVSVAISTPPYDIGTMAFDSSGTLHLFASGALYKIDPATGRSLSAPIAIPLPYEPQGFAFAPVVGQDVPTLSPMAGLLLISAVLAVGALRSRTCASSTERSRSSRSRGH
jgi:DNA-binding beta-propeller fold protein YncE